MRSAASNLMKTSIKQVTKTSTKEVDQTSIQISRPRCSKPDAQRLVEALGSPWSSDVADGVDGNGMTGICMCACVRVCVCALGEGGGR